MPPAPTPATPSVRPPIIFTDLPDSKRSTPLFIRKENSSEKPWIQTSTGTKTMIFLGVGLGLFILIVVCFMRLYIIPLHRQRKAKEAEVNRRRADQRQWWDWLNKERRNSQEEYYRTKYEGRREDGGGSRDHAANQRRREVQNGQRVVEAEDGKNDGLAPKLSVIREVHERFDFEREREPVGDPRENRPLRSQPSPFKHPFKLGVNNQALKSPGAMTPTSPFSVGSSSPSSSTSDLSLRNFEEPNNPPPIKHTVLKMAPTFPPTLTGTTKPTSTTVVNPSHLGPTSAPPPPQPPTRSHTSHASRTTAFSPRSPKPLLHIDGTPTQKFRSHSMSPTGRRRMSRFADEYRVEPEGGYKNMNGYFVKVGGGDSAPGSAAKEPAKEQSVAHRDTDGMVEKPKQMLGVERLMADMGEKGATEGSSRQNPHHHPTEKEEDGSHDHDETSTKSSESHSRLHLHDSYQSQQNSSASSSPANHPEAPDDDLADRISLTDTSIHEAKEINISSPKARSVVISEGSENGSKKSHDEDGDDLFVVGVGEIWEEIAT